MQIEQIEQIEIEQNEFSKLRKNKVSKMNKTQDVWETINLDDENGIEREIKEEIEPKIEVKKSRKKDSVDWRIIAGMWEFRFKCAVGVWVVSLLVFAYVANSLDLEIQQLKTLIEQMK